MHHIKELKEYPNLALDDDNLVSVCTQCHNLRHGRNIRRFVGKKKNKRLINTEQW